MGYSVVVYNDINDRDNANKSKRFDDLSDATKWASDQADKKCEELSGDGVEIMEGAPDFISEYSILGTNAVVILK